METEKMIMELRRIAKNHKNDRLCTGELNLTDMCTDVADRLEDLNEFDKSQSAKLFKDLQGCKDLGVTPEQIREIDTLYTKKCREVAELKKKLNKQWIPVEERLTEERDTVLISTDTGTYAGTYFCDEWYRENMYCYDSMLRETGVMAWMPLPDGYKPIGGTKFKQDMMETGGKEMVEDEEFEKTTTLEEDHPHHLDRRNSIDQILFELNVIENNCYDMARQASQLREQICGWRKDDNKYESERISGKVIRETKF
ncbi:MAG: hypothetical protein [Bacteriophage sp.]|nr:MAG: hypothetical protein [Bacteriophage sp.]